MPDDASLGINACSTAFIKLQLDEGKLNKTPLGDSGQHKTRKNEILYTDSAHKLYFRQYENESDLHLIIPLISKDLSEPYSIYTYRYFIYNWPKTCILAFSSDGECIGTIVCKVGLDHTDRLRGYIAMLAVKDGFRRHGIGSRLVQLAVEQMIEGGCQEVTLETEITNGPALSLYEKLGFCRDKRLLRYYLNGVDAFRLKLWLKS